MAYSAPYNQTGTQINANMQKELGWSVGLHLVLVLAGVIYLPNPSKMIVPDYALPVDIISTQDFANLTQTEESVPQDIEPQAEAKPAPPAPPPAPLAEQADIMPELASKPPETPAAEATETANFIATQRPAPRPTPPAALIQQQRKPLLDTGRVLALLDKTPDRPVAPASPAPQNPNTLPPTLAPAGKLNISEIESFRIQIRQCWRVPAGARAADNLIVRIRVGLRPDGSIASGPYVVNRARLGDRYFRAAAESVLRAIRRCQPFQMPVEKYQNWRELELNFDPGKMLG